VNYIMIIARYKSDSAWFRDFSSKTLHPLCFMCGFPGFLITISRFLKRYLKAKSTSLFTSAVANQRGFSKGGLREAQVRFPEYQDSILCSSLGPIYGSPLKDKRIIRRGRVWSNADICGKWRGKRTLRMSAS